MKKTLLVYLFACLITVSLLAGCLKLPISNSGNSGSLHGSGETAGNNNPTVTDPPSNTDTPKTDGYKYLVYFSSDNEIENNVSDFENGMAVNLILCTQDEGATGKIYIAIINTRGEIIYKLDTGMDKSFSGVDYEVIHIGKEIVCFRYGSAYYVVNSAGKELLNSNDGTIDRVLGASDSNALVYKRTADFSTWDELVGIIDSTGHWLIPMESAKGYKMVIPENADGYKEQNFVDQSGGFSTCKKAEYVGESYYALYYDYKSSGQYMELFNYNSKKILHISSAPEQMTPVRDGKAYAYCPDTLGYAALRSEAIMTIDFNNMTWYRTINQDHLWEYELYSIDDDRMILQFYEGRSNYFDSITPLFMSRTIIDRDYFHLYTCDNSFDQPFLSVHYYENCYVATMVGFDGKNYFTFLNDEMDAFSAAAVYPYEKIISFDNGKLLYTDSDGNYVLMSTDGKATTVNVADYDGSSEIMGFHSGISRVGKHYETLFTSYEEAHRYINEKGETVFAELIDKSVNK